MLTETAVPLTGSRPQDLGLTNPGNFPERTPNLVDGNGLLY